MAKDKLVNDSALSKYTEEMKAYIKTKEVGLTENDVNDLVDKKLVTVNESINDKVGKDDVNVISTDEIDSLFVN